MSVDITNFNGPNLTYPMGSEVIYTSPLVITWEEIDLSTANDIYWYEILFTSDYSAEKTIDWKHIATVPYETTSFSWNIPFSIKSIKCRIGIRIRNQEGKRSKLSISADDFSINDKPLGAPSVFSPMDGQQYFSYVPIVLDNKAVSDSISQRAYYRIYYRSEKQDIDWTLLFDHVRISDTSFYWDVRSIPSSSDYELRIELVDQDSMSVPTFVQNLKIDAYNYFLIDSTAPTGSVSVSNNAQYINTRDLILNLLGYDETTDVETVTLGETDENTGTKTEFPKQPYSNVTTFHIQGSDGVKFITAKLADYGGNIPVDDTTRKYFRTYFEVDDDEISAFLVYKNSTAYEVWAAFSGTTYSLYKDRQYISALTYEATFLSYFSNSLYIAAKNSSNEGILQRYSGGSVATVKTFSDYDSVINGMSVFDSKLFLGMQNGELYTFNGSVFDDVYSFEKKILAMYASENSLFILLENTTDIYVLYRNNGTYSVKTASVLNVDQ